MTFWHCWLEALKVTALILTFAGVTTGLVFAVAWTFGEEKKYRWLFPPLLFLWFITIVALACRYGATHGN